MDCKFAFTIKTEISLALPLAGKFESRPLYTVGGSRHSSLGLADFIRLVDPHVPAEAEEILIYRKSDEGVWELCSRLAMGWTLVKLPKNVKPKSSRSFNKPQYLRYGIFSVDEVLDQVVFPPRSPISRRGPRTRSLREYGQALVKMSGLRYRTFAVKGVVCVECGLVGQYFALEAHKGKESAPRGVHLNLYGVNARGEEVLFTKDHIHPKSRGGSDTLLNLDTMCVICNGKKGDSIPSETLPGSESETA